MKINILEKSKNRLKLELKEESHTLANLLRKELLNDEKVVVSVYNVKHPLVSNPLLIVETEKKEAKQAVSDAVQRLKKKFSSPQGLSKF